MLRFGSPELDICSAKTNELRYQIMAASTILIVEGCSLSC
jgi:hypothetical protein